MATTRKQNAYNYLRHRLLDGTFVPNQRLFPADLAKEIGVSHIPVREAISQLQSEGLVEQIPRRGVFVRQADREEIIELIELRSILERSGAGLAARRINDGQIEELRDRLKELREVGESLRSASAEEMRDRFARWMLIDMEFHLVLLRAAGNRRMLEFFESTHLMMHMFGHRTDHPGGWADMDSFMTRGYEQHRDIYRAVRRHDAKAARRAMGVHMLSARRNILSRFDWLGQQQSVDESQTSDFPDSVRKTLSNIEKQHMRDADDPAEKATRRKPKRKTKRNTRQGKEE